MSELGPFLVVSACFGISTVLGIRLRDDLTVPSAAALAPAAGALSLQVEPAIHWTWMLVGPAVALVTLLAARASALEIGSHVALFLAVSASLRAVGTSHDVLLMTAAGMAGTLVYSLAEVGRQKVSHRGHARIGADSGMWWLLQGVLLCASGLTLLVLDRMGWASVAVTGGVLALTKREFEGFAMSRVALEQTVRALAQLSDRALDEDARVHNARG